MVGKEELEEYEAEVPLEPQSVYEATVIRIFKGKLKDLVDINAIRSDVVRERMKKNADRDALEVWYDVDGKQYKEVVLISRHPNSKLVKILKTYGKLEKGMKIQVYTTKWGYPRIKVKT